MVNEKDKSIEGKIDEKDLKRSTTVENSLQITPFYAKQSQFQVSQYQLKFYNNKHLRLIGQLVIQKKTNPIQSQFKPKQTQFNPIQSQFTTIKGTNFSNEAEI